MEERSCGIIRETSGRRVGRQAHIMPTLHSIADQEAAPTLSSICFRPLCVSLDTGYRGIGLRDVQVGSDESEIFFRATRRHMLVTQTLDFVTISLCHPGI